MAFAALAPSSVTPELHHSEGRDPSAERGDTPGTLIGTTDSGGNLGTQPRETAPTWTVLDSASRRARWRASIGESAPNQMALWTIYELVSVQAARVVGKIRSGSEGSTGDGNWHRFLSWIVGAALRPGALWSQRPTTVNDGVLRIRCDRSKVTKNPLTWQKGSG